MSPNAPRPAGTRAKRSDARRNRDTLLKEAHALFTAEGTEASLGEIARRSGVSIGTLYRHFPTRDALLKELLQDHLEALSEAAEQRLDHDAPLDALAEWLELGAARTLTYRGLPASIAAALQEEGSELHTACHRMSEAGTQLIVSAQRAGVVREDVAPSDVLALTGAIAWLGEQEDDPGERQDRLLALVLRAVSTPGAFK